MFIYVRMHVSFHNLYIIDIQSKSSAGKFIFNYMYTCYAPYTAIVSVADV